MIRKFIAVFSMLAVFVPFIFTSQAFAASSSRVPLNTHYTAPIDFTSLQTTCAVTSVHLEGTTHTVTCLKVKAKTASTLNPLIGRNDSCGASQIEMIIYNYNYNGVLCFWGTGYLAVAIYQVNEVDNVSNAGEWFRWYQPGTFTSLISKAVKYFGNPVYVTQLCIGSTVGGQC